MPPLKLEGIMPPMVTPFTRDEALDEKDLRSEINFLIKAGVHGLVTTGSTGEGVTLSEDEHRRVFEITVEETKGRVPVLCGIVPDSTRQAVHLGKLAKAAGAAALQVTPTHYFPPKPEGIIDYYQRIAGEVGLPVLIYNIVQTVPLSAELVAKLAEIDGVIGIKQSVGGLNTLADILRLTPKDFIVFSAVNDLLFPSLVLGAKGAVTALNTILPEPSLKLYQAVREKRYDEALAIHNRLLPVVRAAYAPNFPAGIKEALNLLGRPGGFPRSPMLPCTEEERERIQAALKEAGAL